MRKLVSAVAAFLLGALAVEAQPPNRKGGGGLGLPKNLQVLDPATFPRAMQSFVEALGVATPATATALPRQRRH